MFLPNFPRLSRGQRIQCNPRTERQSKRKKRGSDSPACPGKSFIFIYTVSVWLCEKTKRTGSVVVVWICHGSSGKCQERSGSLARIESRVALAGKPVWLWHRQDPSSSSSSSSSTTLLYVSLSSFAPLHTEASHPTLFLPVTSPGFRLL